MWILCDGTFNGAGSVLKSVFAEWGPMFSRRDPVWPGAPPHNGGPGHPSCAEPSSSTATTTSSFSSSSCSTNLFKQIKSTLLFHLTFIWRATPPSPLCPLCSCHGSVLHPLEAAAGEVRLLIRRCFLIKKHLVKNTLEIMSLFKHPIS